MKINIEYTEEEYKSLVGLGSRMMDSFDNMIDKIHDQRLTRISRSVKTIISDLVDEDSFEEESDSEEALDFESKKSELKVETSQKWDDQYVSRGKLAFDHLVRMWAENFNVPGQQPDRASRVVELRDSYDGRALLHYLESLKSQSKGLTYAVRDTHFVENHQIRLLAENIAQVTSALSFSQVASYLEYPDPSQLEDFYNV